jgi:citrate synthase
MSTNTTHIATSDATSITVRGMSLTGELMPQRTFTEMIYFLTCGTLPDASQARVLDVCLVTLMEHGWTPTSIITRMTIDSVPDQVQVAMAAGLLTVGSVFAGTIEGCARILQSGIDEPDAQGYCERVVKRFRDTKDTLPGFGHRAHKPDDPRTPVILQVAREAGHAGRYVDLLLQLSTAVDVAHGKHLTINATGAIAAVLLEIGVPAAAMRGIAVISRAGGLLGHVLEERETHAAREIWKLTRENIGYEHPEGKEDADGTA